MGYRDNRTSGVAIRGKPEGMYMVSSGTHFNSGCCFDYGNAETSATDTGAGHMDALNVSRDLEWPNCRDEPGPGVHADRTPVNRSDATFCPRPGKNGKANSFYAENETAKYIRHYYGKVYIAGDGEGANPWDTRTLWSDDTSFIVSPPWSP